MKLDITEIMDPKKRDEVKAKFESRANFLLSKHFPTLSEQDKKVLTAYLLQNSLGLGDLEPLMHDDNLEEIAINSSAEPVWVYHKKYGWCKTNVTVQERGGHLRHRRHDRQEDRQADKRAHTRSWTRTSARATV